MNLLNIKIETKRLLLIPIEIKYLDDIFREFTKEIAKYMTPQPTGKKEDTEEFILNSRKELKKGLNLQLVGVDKESGEFIGCFGAHKILTRTPELGLWLKKSEHSKGYGKEAMFAIKKWIDENLDCEYIYYPVVKMNTASRKIAEALGGELCGEIIKQNTLGEDMDEVEYKIYKK